MPVERRLDPATQVLRTTLSGRLTIEELREHFARVAEMRAQRNPEMIDGRGVSGVTFGTRDLPKLAEFGRHMFGHSNMAPRAVVVKGVVYFGMARLFAAIVAGWVQIQVFDNMSSAEAWLTQFLARLG